ncbi:MAG: SDR family oxidoreductase [Rhodospirillales bacterium]
MTDTRSPASRTGSIVVTGAAKRIGRAIALDLVANGWPVVVHCHQSFDAASELVDTIRSDGGRAALVQADLANEDETARLIERAAGALGPVVGLINNASVFEHDTPMTATRETWDRHMEINLRAPFILIQAFVRQLPNKTEGNVINIIDQRVWNPTPEFTSYTLSKAGLWSLTKTLAQGLAPNVRVNAIGPGPTLRNVHQTESAFENEWSSVLLGRKVEIGEICDAVRFILGAHSMTGQMLALDSGQHLRWSVMTPDPGTPPEDSTSGSGSSL